MSVQAAWNIHIQKIALGIVFICSVLLNGMLLMERHNRTVVISVVDGDSIQLRDGRRVRLLSIDAPERDACMGYEARDALHELVNNKHVTLTDSVTDQYGRQLSNVYAGTVFVNDQMVRSGLARFTSVASPEFDRLKDAHTYAKTNKLGIYSAACRNTNPTSDCIIKGNVRNDVKTYLLPDCPNYNQTIIDTSFGDGWFCSETDAQRQGFTKAKGCQP